MRDRYIFCAIGFIGAFLASCLAYGYQDENAPVRAHFSSYKPTYFLLGHPDTKIQISFKAQIVEAIPIYLAYSQLMMWDVFQTSAPFRDINFNPILFFRRTFSEASQAWVDFGLYDHESNGKSDLDSRSWDRVYLLYASKTSLSKSIKLFWSIKAWLPFNYDPTNTDIAEYRGIWELNVTFANFLHGTLEEGDLSLRFYPGGSVYLNPIRGGQELTLRTRLGQTRFLPLWVFQIFHGYGENLLNYKENRFSFRLGVGF